MSCTPTLDRVLETCLYVDDIDRAARFYEDILGLPVLTADSASRRARAASHCLCYYGGVVAGLGATPA